MNEGLQQIRKLVGGVNPEQLRYVDCFIGEQIAVFMPQGGACFYALASLHSHPSYMFIFSFNDQTRLVVDGKTMALTPGRIFSLSPGIAHHELPSEFPPRYVAVFINGSFFDSQLSQYQVRRDIVFRGESHDAPSNFLSLLKEFMIEANSKAPGGDSVLHALSIEICHSIIRSMFGINPLHDRKVFRMEIGRAVEYIHSNLGRKINVEEMAEIANMSPSHFSRIFKEEIGKSPIDYLNQTRLNRAKKLLLAGDKSITEIALECGFGSSAYFSDRFFKKFKLTPSEYQKNLISKKNGGISKDGGPLGIR
jgi:AraC-like DNA-binding protein